MLTPPRSLPRRLLVAGAALALTAASLTAVSSPAYADTTNLYVVGTSDVSDSGLITATSALTQGFEAAYPQYNLLYTGTGTGNAITTAENGGAAALIVHAPSLENQFVASNYSEGVGDALFWGDFVLLGPSSDPAGVAADATSPIKAFEAIAAAGEAGKAEFVSRGGNPGTTVAEHQIWAQTTGVPTCNIDASPDGGGTAPTMQADAGTNCTPTTQNQPDWYKITGDKQADNIEAANACDFGQGDDCYVLTDRGTYENLVNGTGPTGDANPSNLTELVRNTTASAQTSEGQLLVNTFHGYVINPASVPANSKTDVTGATDFLDYVTSPAGQKIVGQYLSDIPSDPNDPPFLPDSTPKIKSKALPAQLDGGQALDVTGSLNNVVPGTPALSGVQVQLLATPTSTPDATPQQVASGETDSTGAFSIKYTPQVNMTYTLGSPAITKIEYPNLDPQFADQLQATTKTLRTVDVKATVTKVTATGGKGRLDVKATTLPAHTGKGATLTLFAHPAGSTKPFTSHGQTTLKPGADTVHQTFSLAKGKWRYYLRYSNAGSIVSGSSTAATVTVS